MGLHSFTHSFIHSKKTCARVPLQHSKLRIWCCHFSDSSCCYGSDSVPGPGPSTCCWCGPPQKRKEKMHSTYGAMPSICGFAAGSQPLSPMEARGPPLNLMPLKGVRPWSDSFHPAAETDKPFYRDLRGLLLPIKSSVC